LDHVCYPQAEEKAAAEGKGKEGDEKPAWVEEDMTGRPIEEVIEYEVTTRRLASCVIIWKGLSFPCSLSARQAGVRGPGLDACEPGDIRAVEGRQGGEAA
jgi:hypothetical protein